MSAPAQAWPPQPVLTARRVIAFTGMVFGMFMASLDIQIVSASLTKIQAGLSASAEEIRRLNAPTPHAAAVDISHFISNDYTIVMPIRPKMP